MDYFVPFLGSIVQYILHTTSQLFQKNFFFIFPKEYILVRERTAPPLRVSNICPPNLSLLCLQYTPTT